MRGFVAGLLLLGGLAHADDSQHRGSLGLTVAFGVEGASGLTPMATGDSGFRLPIEVGGTLGLFTHTELFVAGRLAPPIAPSMGYAASFYAGARNAFGPDALKTFFDIALAVHATPYVTVGARVGVGVQYDFLPIMGVYAALTGQLVAWQALRLSLDLSIGIQFRTYLFE